MPQTTTATEPIDNYPELKAMGFKRNSTIGEFDVKSAHLQVHEYIVYLLFDGLELVYIGKTKDHNRLTGHYQKIFDAVYYMPNLMALINGVYHNNIEHELIKKYGTKYNRCSASKKYHPELTSAKTKLNLAKAELARHEKQVERLKQQITLLESNQQLN